MASVLAKHPGEDAESGYQRLNTLRAWVNDTLGTAFELYLEDVWNEDHPGETWIEYILRSRKTLNETPRLGYDRYYNHQDAKGVWHLDDYITTVCHVNTKADCEALAQFMAENGLA